MKILILGGSQLVGWNIVAAARAAGHDLTLFNRGRTNAGDWPGVERIVGDRDGDLPRLAGRQWNSVIDCSGYDPRLVTQSAEFLREAVEHYTFISTESVYRASTDIDEDGVVIELEPGAPPDPDSATTYGGLKVRCERAVRAVYGARSLVIRPGLVVGPRDHTDRFTHWVRRAAAPGEMLLPGPPGRRTQLIDARDLAAFVLARTLARDSGTFNTSGPATSLTFGGLVDACFEATAESAPAPAVATPVWVDHAFLVAAGATSTELPFWFSDDDNPDAPGELEISSRRAIASGLTFRPLLETVRDTLRWDRMRPADFTIRPGPLSAERERELLAAWRARG